MQTIHSLAAPVGRILISLIFIVSGFGKIAGYAGTQAFMESVGVPGQLLPLVIALEIVGGLAVALGWHARLAAFLLAGFSLLSGLIFHADFGDQMQMIMFWKNLGLAGGFLMIVLHGAGPWSIDNRRAAAGA
ncbi:MAG: DoxX family protein [Xanthomonadales bacterium]|nr:DoxX family protein [Xanthomonadales bacterium]NNK38024.1 DoxX family protein [Xanthomonadales bacterium]